jgi:hypothetical protein
VGPPAGRLHHRAAVPPSLGCRGASAPPRSRDLDRARGAARLGSIGGGAGSGVLGFRAIGTRGRGKVREGENFCHGSWWQRFIRCNGRAV